MLTCHVQCAAANANVVIYLVLGRRLTVFSQQLAHQLGQESSYVLRRLLFFLFARSRQSGSRTFLLLFFHVDEEEAVRLIVYSLFVQLEEHLIRIDSREFLQPPV